MEVVVGIIFFAIAIAWISWPVMVFADEAYIDIWEALLIFLAGSVLLFLISLAVTYLFSRQAVVYSPPPQSATAPSSSDTTSITPDGLIRDHSVRGRKVAAYETHRIAGFEFLFAVVPWPREEYRIYILKSPSYGRRSSGAHETHRLSDGAFECRFICVASNAYPHTLTEARELALMWAQATARYIKTGKNFG